VISEKIEKIGKIPDFEKKAKNVIFVAYLRTLEKFILVI
jgi:hypothetical protein